MGEPLPVLTLKVTEASNTEASTSYFHSIVQIAVIVTTIAIDCVAFVFGASSGLTQGLQRWRLQNDRLAAVAQGIAIRGVGAMVEEGLTHLMVVIPGGTKLPLDKR